MKEYSHGRKHLRTDSQQRRANRRSAVFSGQESILFQFGQAAKQLLIQRQGQLEDLAPQQLPDKGQTIIVYCDYGGMSKKAAEKLAAISYTNVVEFDGMEVWNGETIHNKSVQ